MVQVDRQMKRETEFKVDMIPDRPYNDRRYYIDFTKAKAGPFLSSLHTYLSRPLPSSDLPFRPVILTEQESRLGSL